MDPTVVIACIDEEISRHRLLVSNLRSKRNSFVIISRLPDEILASIFTHGARDYHEGNDHASFCVPDWVSVSYVCRRWRDVALNCPTLWTYHFTVSLRWTEELLARSKQASLRIYIKYASLGPGPWWSDLVEKVLNHAERIQELRLHIPATLFPTRLSLYAPRLQILDIFAHARAPFEWTAAINYWDIPSLRTLKLTNCPLPWHSLNLSRVTTLVLTCVPTSFRQNPVEFLATLSRTQALTVLHLEYALSSALFNGALGVYPRVALPYLARLLVLAPISTVVALLSCINIPLETQVRLEIPDDGTAVNDYAQLPPLFAQRFSQSEDLSSFCATIRSLVVNVSPNGLTLVVCASGPSDCDPRLSMAYPPRECSAYLTILIMMNPSIFTDINSRDCLIGDICCSIPSTHVQTLHVIDPPLPSDFWRKTLGHLRGLRYMKLSDGCVPDLVSLLAILETPNLHVASNHDLAQDREFVPALEELELYRIRFRFMDEDSLSQKSLPDTLSTRKARISLIDCTTGEDESDSVDDDSDVDSLAEIADDV